MEQLRKMVTNKEIDIDNESKKFGIAVLGFNKREVSDHIDAMSTHFKSSIISYENKLSEQTTALSMALREKEKLSEELEKLKKKVEVLSVDVDEQKSEVVAENIVLKTRIEDLSDVEHRNEMLISEINNLKSRCEYSEAGKKELLDTIQEKEEIILEQCRKHSEIEKSLKIEIERIRTEYESKANIYELKIQTTKDNLTKALSVLNHG